MMFGQPVELTYEEARRVMEAIGRGEGCTACGKKWELYRKDSSGTMRMLNHTNSCAYIRAQQRYDF